MEAGFMETNHREGHTSIAHLQWRSIRLIIFETSQSRLCVKEKRKERIWSEANER